MLHEGSVAYFKDLPWYWSRKLWKITMKNHHPHLAVEIQTRQLKISNKTNWAVCPLTVSKLFPETEEHPNAIKSLTSSQRYNWFHDVILMLMLFRADGDGTLHRNLGMYLPVCMASRPRTTSPSPGLSQPQIRTNLPVTSQTQLCSIKAPWGGLWDTKLLTLRSPQTATRAARTPKVPAIPEPRNVTFCTIG